MPTTPKALDQLISIETPEQVVFSYTIAGLGSRAAAALIDHALLFGGLLVLALLYTFVLAPGLGLGGESLLPERAAGWLIAIFVLLVFVLQWGYYVLFEALRDGQTPGKRWLRLRVVQDGGYSVSFAASAVRNIARVLDMQPVVSYLVGLIAVAASRTGKRAGDHLAGTIVVRERIVTAALPGPAQAAAGAATSHATADAPAAGPPLLTPVIPDDELELLRRFLDRTATLDPDARARLVVAFRDRYRAHLPDTGDDLDSLRELLAREHAARAAGMAAPGETGAAREWYALLAEGEPRWARFAGRLAIAQRRGLHRMSAAEVADFVAEYRAVATDLARLTTASRGRNPDVLFRLSRLVAGGHNLLYRRRPVAARAAARYLFGAVPAEVRRSAAPILFAALLLFGSGAVACIGVIRQPSLAQQLVGPGMIDRAESDAAQIATGEVSYIDVDEYSRPLLATSVLRNNVQVSFIAFASGLTAGIFTVLLLLTNGISIGAAIGLFANYGIARLIIDFVIAHGVFELTAICVAAGGGFLIANAILLPGPRTRREALVLQGRRALRLLTAAALFLTAAGFIEGLISPRTDLGLGVKAAVAGVSAVAIVAYLGLGGKRAEGEAERMAYSDDRALIER